MPVDQTIKDIFGDDDDSDAEERGRARPRDDDDAPTHHRDDDNVRFLYLVIFWRFISIVSRKKAQYAATTRRTTGNYN